MNQPNTINERPESSDKDNTVLLELQEIKANSEAIIFSVSQLSDFIQSANDFATEEEEPSDSRLLLGEVLDLIDHAQVLLDAHLKEFKGSTGLTAAQTETQMLLSEALPELRGIHGLLDTRRKALISAGGAA